MRTITRSALVDAVKFAALVLPDPENRAKVLEFAKHTPRVAVGAWSLDHPDGDTCVCPIAGAGIDSVRMSAAMFAQRFDREFGVDLGVGGVGTIFEVIDDE